MVKGIKSGKRHQIEWYQHNNWDYKRTSQKDPELEEPDGIQGYWLKKLTLHKCITKQMDNIISNREDIQKWMTLNKMVLCQKDPSKGNASL